MMPNTSAGSISVGKGEGVEAQPKFSIIIAVFNGARTLQKCIDSIVAQTYLNFEIIIIDGGSKDGTVALIEGNKNNIASWISEPDTGIYNAWNKGLLKATGDWICFLGSDDFFWDSSVLQRINSQLNTVPAGVRVLYNKMAVVNAKGESLFLVGDSWVKIESRFKQVMCIPHPGAMHHHSLFRDNGKFDESFRIAGDYEFLLRELKFGAAFYIGEDINIGMTQGGVSSNPVNALLSLDEARRAQRMHGFLFPSPYWVLAKIRVSFRLLLWNLIGESKTRKVLDIYRHLVRLPPYWTKT